MWFPSVVTFSFVEVTLALSPGQQVPSGRQGNYRRGEDPRGQSAPWPWIPLLLRLSCWCECVFVITCWIWQNCPADNTVKGFHGTGQPQVPFFPSYVPLVQPDISKCNGRGYMKCGVCFCDEGYYGKECQCGGDGDAIELRWVLGVVADSGVFPVLCYQSLYFSNPSISPLGIMQAELPN